MSRVAAHDDHRLAESGHSLAMIVLIAVVVELILQTECSPVTMAEKKDRQFFFSTPFPTLRRVISWIAALPRT